MKTILNLVSIIFISTLFIFTSCKGKDDPDPTVSFGQKLSGTWKLNNVTLDNSDVTNEFSGFSVNFTSHNDIQGTFTCTNTNDVIFSDGTYVLNGTSSMTLSNGGENINVNLTLSEDGKTLIFSFHNDKTTFTPGRILGITGDYVFELIKQ